VHEIIIKGGQAMEDDVILFFAPALTYQKKY